VQGPDDAQDRKVETIKLGISRCLLGEKVRYDGGHKEDHFLTDTLGVYVDWIGVCPEVECGLAVPREAMRLVGNPASPRLKTIRSDIDHTDRMLAWAQNRLSELDEAGLCGFVFKSKSPSSGMERVKVYGPSGMPAYKGVGLFARAFMDHFPLIPVEDEGRLHDPSLRENFIEQVFVYHGWQKLVAGDRSLKGLIDFHTNHKLLVLAHSPKHYTSLGRLVASAASIEGDIHKEYVNMLMESLRLIATPRKNTNVLMHMAGYFKKRLSQDEKGELADLINQYYQGFVPLIVPITLIKHYVRKHEETYLSRQLYLNPHPLELMLRNHV
jgi:uncharacterized protein YbgA (DUF1722 family)/uncharacterized protein YbbK (DUF523 family)